MRVAVSLLLLMAEKLKLKTKKWQDYFQTKQLAWKNY